MPFENPNESLKDGTFVKILRSGFKVAKIVAYRGPLGPGGSHIYRVLVATKPRRTYIEVREDQLEVIERPKSKRRPAIAPPATETL